MLLSVLEKIVAEQRVYIDEIVGYIISLRNILFQVVPNKPLISVIKDRDVRFSYKDFLNLRHFFH